MAALTKSIVEAKVDTVTSYSYIGTQLIDATLSCATNTISFHPAQSTADASSSENEIHIVETASDFADNIVADRFVDFSDNFSEGNENADAENAWASEANTNSWNAWQPETSSDNISETGEEAGGMSEDVEDAPGTSSNMNVLDDTAQPEGENWDDVPSVNVQPEVRSAYETALLNSRLALNSIPPANENEFTGPIQTFFVGVENENNAIEVTSSGRVVNLEHYNFVIGQAIPALQGIFGYRMNEKVCVLSTTIGQKEVYEAAMGVERMFGKQDSQLPQIAKVEQGTKKEGVELTILDAVNNDTVDLLQTLKHGEMVCWQVLDRCVARV
ncbi:hypothetical protein LTR56_001597 [Elasticomyces elasticus]|nr:hypothetical protein LTR56_001597 [Elasticomyces elasticus]KAK3667351.1 hypothetical protein LTR22_001867 [Elasticomyces elasticus]KAK4932569.1 hypothetical protein LTR49_000993 [Elasticomyces elasticus]KAK5769591.1 hypothetical protein LTS12_000041 [Elasticomyces elasticus]